MASKEPFYQQVADKIISQLKEGTAPWIKPWTGGESFIPHNPVSGTRYRGGNAIWLAAVAESEGYKDSRWLTYKQASSLDAQVRKGQKGTRVQYWKFSEEKPLLDENGRKKIGPDGKALTVQVQLERPRVFHAVVFNGDQIDRMPEQQVKKYQWNPSEKAEEILANSGAKIVHKPGDRAFYSPGNDMIQLPEKTQFASPDKYYATALHELGHWTGHGTRLDRDMLHPFGSQGYAKEELRAEIASMMMGDDIGIGHEPGQHVAYIDSWIKILEDDPKEILRASADAEKIMTFVKSLEHTQEKVQTAEKTSELSADIENKIREVWSLTRPEQRTSEDHPKHPGVLMLADGGQRMESLRELAEKNDLTINALSAERQLQKAISEKAELKQLKELVWNHTEKTNKSRIEDKDHPWIYDPKIAAPKPKDKVFLHDLGSGELKKHLNRLEGEKRHASQVYRDFDLSQFEHRKASAPERKPEEKNYISVPYREKNQAKALGARWDREKKSWWVPEGKDLTKFSRWIQTASSPRQDAGLSPQQEFASALKDAGLILDGSPVMDGNFHRVPVEGGKPGRTDGSYKGFLDGIPAGFIQNHKTGLKTNWKAKGYHLSDQQKSSLLEHAITAKKHREMELQKTYEKKSLECERKWQELRGADDSHQYLKTKGVKSYGLKANDQDELVIPARDIQGKIWSLQRVTKQFKSMEKNARLQGCFHLIGKMSSNQKMVLLAEGYSTAASLHQATGLPVAMAFSSTNLKNVALEIKKSFPETSITVCADSDRHLVEKLKTNPGRKAGIEAANAVGGKVVVPVFCSNETGKDFTDFNDLHRVRGLETVKRQITNSISQKTEQSRVTEKSTEPIKQHAIKKSREEVSKSKSRGMSL